MVLVDSNILIDITTVDPKWVDWSAEQLAKAADEEGVAINPLIYAEVSRGYDNSAQLDASLPPMLVRLPLPYEAAFPAADAFDAYRRRGGAKISPLVDFFVGAHAQQTGMKILTRDAARFRSYFPAVPLIAPPDMD